MSFWKCSADRGGGTNEIVFYNGIYRISSNYNFKNYNFKV
jgi:hypothetical protein